MGTDGDGESIRLQQLLQIGKAVNSTLDLQTVLQTIVGIVCEQTDWKMACIALVDEPAQEVTFVAERGFRNSRSDRMRWSIGESITPKATAAGKTIVVEDTLKLTKFPVVRSSSLLRGFRSVLISPLKHVDPPAALWLCRKRPTHFTPRDIVFAEAVADQAAIAIRNAGLYRQQKSRAEELMRAQRTLGMLMNMVLENQTVNDVQRTIASLLGNPLWFEDRSGQRIPKDGGPIAPNSPASGQPITWTAGDRTALAVPVSVGIDFYGWLLSLDEHRSFTELDVLIVQQTALVFALVFLRDRVHHEVELRLRTDLFASLVASTNGELEEDLRRRARALNIDLPDPARVCMVDIRHRDGANGRQFRQSLGEILRLTTARFPDRLAALQDECIAMLIKPGEEDRVAELMLEIHRYFPESRPILAVGDVAEEDVSLQDSFLSAKKILRVASFISIDQAVLRSEDLGVYALLFDENRSRELEAFRRRILGKLVQNDVRGTLFSTLESLCSNNFNLEATARGLSIHISTLRYRLDRIRAISGLGWEDAATRLQLEVAIVIERWHRHGFRKQI